MSTILSRRRAGTFEHPEVPPAAPPSLAEQLDAERTAHAHEKEAHDLARAMLGQRFEEIERLRAELETERAHAAELLASHGTLREQLAATMRERDTMKAAVDALEAQLAAPAETPAPARRPRG